MDTIRELLPVKNDEKASSSNEAGGGIRKCDPIDIEDCPWLFDCVQNKRNLIAVSRLDSAVAAQVVASAACAAEEFSHIDKAVEEAAVASLADKRAELVGEGAYADGFFTWKLLGGAWTKAHLGVDFDTVKGEAQGAEAKHFCHQYKLQASASFKINAYGEATAITLVQLWVARMSYLYDLFLLSGDEKYKFTPDDLAGFEEPPEFVVLAESASGRSAQRVQWLRTFAPKS